MNTCLYCGAQLSSTTAHFCRGHHRPYRNNLINTWQNSAEGSAERAQAGTQLRRFPGWWDYDNNAPVIVNRSESRAQDRQVTARRVRTNTRIEYRFRKFGIELETASPSETCLTSAIEMAKASGINVQNTRYTHERTAYWKVLTDGSLSGGYCREIVSPAFDSEAGFDEVYKLASILNTMGVKTNNTCGFHCHLDAHDLTPKQMARIVLFYQVYESEIDKLHQRSRRGADVHYCGGLSRFRIFPDDITSVSDLTHILGTRYLKVNVEAYLRHGTIEFRQHGATVDPLKIVNWVKFCTRIVEYAKTDNEINANIPLFEALNLSESEKIYWNRRKEILAA